MPRLSPRVTIRIPAGRPHRHNGNWSSRSFALLLIRHQAESGLLRDGGLTPPEVSRYVRRLRQEVEEEVALRKRPRSPAPPAA